MLRDPFYQQIYQALDGHLDPLLFERCMGDLLRQDYPWIVPVSGGTDSGMDGAIADGEGEPFPLVCTTDSDVIGNLTRSLDSYRNRGLPRRKVVLATSRRLTQRRQENLFKRAREKGFELLQIFERDGVADRLADSPRWCKELLGLTWKPSALSTLPRTSRPLLDIELVGRESDLTWIVDTSGDRVISGEPGSGKTFLFRHLMRKRDWPGLFLADTDLKEIRAAWLELRPRVVVVDDAHIEPDLLKDLARLRQEMAVTFDIVAVTWERARPEVEEALGVPATRVHKLELLTRDEIAEVFRRAGVEASDQILRDLVSQSANKPGLAVTLASLWKQGSYQEVLEGTALTRTLTTFFSRFLGPKSKDVLACLALGGDRGMPLEEVGKFLQESRSTVRELASGLASGGVLSQVDRDTLAVWPRKLRFSLIRSVFFPESAAGYDYRELLDRVPSRENTVETIVAAKLHGAEIPVGDLRGLVLQSGSRAAWRGLAYLSEADALWVLEQYPGDLIGVADAALTTAGEEVIRRLLKRTETAEGEPHSRSDHPLRILQAWIQDLNTPPAEIVSRRKLLARTLKEYLKSGGQRAVAFQGLGLILAPTLESQSSDPGMGRTITFRSGLLHLEQLREVETLWVDLFKHLGPIDTEDWQHFSPVLWNWMYPSYASKGRPVPEETQGLMKSFAARVLKDVASSALGKPGLAAKVDELARKTGLDVQLELDPVFGLLFPSLDKLNADRKNREKEWKVSLQELADCWVREEPAEVTARLVGYEKEAQRIGRAWPPRGDMEVCRRIAAVAEVPETWLDEFLTRGASGVLTGPFVEEIVAAGRDGWERQAERCLGLERQHAWSAVEAIFNLSSPPDHLLERALQRVEEFPQLLEGLCLLRKVHVETLKRLFHHPRWELGLTAAIGEWNSDRESGVRAEVAADWRFAVLSARTDNAAAQELRSPGRDLWLGAILASDPNLACDWLTARLWDQEGQSFIAGDGPFTLALSVLSRDQRLQLVEELAKCGERAPWGIVGSLVGTDLEILGRVLEEGPLWALHLEPLEFLPDESWMELALLALEAGHGLDEVVEAPLWPKGQIRVLSGTGLENWQEHERAFARFETDPRGAVREIARRGRELAAEERQKAEERERQFAIHGRYV